MKWSPQQDAALLAVKHWLESGTEQVFRVFGFAGTGKTLLAQYFAEGVEGQVLAGAYTGKAAHVLRQKNFDQATTIHSLIYHTKEKSRAKLLDMEAQLGKLKNELRVDGMSLEEIEQHRRVKDLKELMAKEHTNAARPIFSLNMDSAVKDAALVIIDECSMVDEQMGIDLLSFGTKVLVWGDPAQLPPVMGEGYFTSGIKPHIMLTEIQRQAKDNPIIDMATRVRLGNKLKFGNYGSSCVIKVEKFNAEMALGADQILVGRNLTRHTYNERIRQLHGRKGQLPEKGDRLVCLRNNHETGLLNGAIWFVDEFLGDTGDQVGLNILPEDGGNLLTVNSHAHYFYGNGKDLPWWERKEADEFDYGYALTCHKSQGSQWDDVLVMDESYCFRKDKNRWLYTAITRAAERVTIVN
ncbi:MAG: AAA family ATPase [Gammaproteobacteria bacterium]|nr:AAA family ATPase [Gammaproteobacteria bacterium]